MFLYLFVIVWLVCLELLYAELLLSFITACVFVIGLCCCLVIDYVVYCCHIHRHLIELLGNSLAISYISIVYEYTH